MKILDLEQLDDKSTIDTDLCIVGAGPAGLSIANEFIGTGTRVLVLESGGLKDESNTDALNEIESVGAPRKMDPMAVRRRILGGSSHIWVGRCAPFDSLDFEKRSWIPYSGWPTTRAQLEPYIGRAGTNLGLGPNCDDDTLWQQFKVREPMPSVNPKFLEPMFWQFRSGGPVRFGRDFVNSNAQNIQILLHTNVMHINTSVEGDRFESVDVGTLSGKRALVKANILVLCCGGIENARLLLASNRKIPQGVGNQNDLVGRFLMDHAQCVVWDLNQRDADSIVSRMGSYWLRDEYGKHSYLDGLALSRDIQRKEGLVNCHAFVDQIAVDNDPWSALKRLQAPSLRSERISKIFSRDARIVMSHPGEIFRGVFHYRVKHRQPLIKAAHSAFAVMLEQVPDPESRITLSVEKRDALGMPLSKINWKISDLERQTAWRMAKLVSQEFERLRLSLLQVPAWLDEQEQFVSRCEEKAHPTGMTRMSASAKEGVVDENCQVFGVKGLFVSGSSIFPTSGAANPTLMIVAMALRLADWLKAHHLTRDI